MTEPKIAIAITANDQTAKGAKSAEKRLGGVPKHVSAVNRRAWADDERRVSRHGRAMVRTFGSVEQAGARMFGGRSITSGFTSRLGAAREAAAGLGTGLGEASAAGGVLSSTIGAVGVAAAGTIGILAAAGYAAVNFANNWADGAAKIGRTASIIGVSTKALQEFEAAGQRAGMAKGAATGTLGSLSQTLNDARYGRNSGALAVLGRMGVTMKTKADGTVDIEAMLPAIADALARQNSSGRRTAGGILGISPDALPVLTQGGKALAADMKDADKHAAVLDDGQIATGQRIARKGVMVGQLKDRALSEAGAGTAGALERGYDATISAGRWLTDGASDFKGTVDRSFRPAAEKIDRAATRMASAAGRGVIGVTREFIGAAQAAERKYGVPASVTIGQYGLESSYGRHMPAGSNNPFGIKARKGEPFVTARTREEDRWGRSYYTAARFRKFGSLSEAVDAHARLLATGRPYARARAALPSVDAYADALTGTYATDRRYGSKLKNVIHRNGFDQYDGGGHPIPVKVEVEMRGAPAGTRTKVTAGGGSRPAVSHAYQPVHRG